LIHKYLIFKWLAPASAVHPRRCEGGQAVKQIPGGLAQGLREVDHDGLGAKRHSEHTVLGVEQMGARG
jgi:hypothetical protein